MIWFTVHVLIKACNPEGDCCQGREVMYLVQADDAAGAQEKGLELASREYPQTWYVNGVKGEADIDRVLGVHEVGHHMLTHGTQVYNKFLEPDELDHLEQIFEDKPGKTILDMDMVY